MGCLQSKNKVQQDKQQQQIQNQLDQQYNSTKYSNYSTDSHIQDIPTDQNIITDRADLSPVINTKRRARLRQNQRNSTSNQYTVTNLETQRSESILLRQSSQPVALQKRRKLQTLKNLDDSNLNSNVQDQPSQYDQYSPVKNIRMESSIGFRHYNSQPNIILERENNQQQKQPQIPQLNLEKIKQQQQNNSNNQNYNNNLNINDDSAEKIEDISFMDNDTTHTNNINTYSPKKRYSKKI